MKKIFALMLSALILSTVFSGAASADGFFKNPDALKGKLKSVLRLEVYADVKLIAAGSGFCAFDSSTLVTSYHLIKGADYILAYSDDGIPHFVFYVLTADPDRDIAILSSLVPTGLSPLPLKIDAPLRRAEKVVAIGCPLDAADMADEDTIGGIQVDEQFATFSSPFGDISNTVTAGVISDIYTDEGVRMIRFTAPISHGFSGGPLFDDSDSVIGITTSTLTDGQDTNLAVHISEAAALYDSWDGSRTEINGYQPKKSSRTTAASRPGSTPKPTPGSSPAPEPFVTFPITDAFKNNKPDSAADLKIESVTMQSDGGVSLEWSGGTGPYKVHFQIVDDRSQDDILYNRFYWYEEESPYTTTSAVMESIVPDHLYRIDVTDSTGNRAFRFFRYESRSFSGFDGQRNAVGLRSKKNDVISKVTSFSCSALEASVKNGTSNDTRYGLYVEIGHGDLSRNYDFTMRLVFEMPNGDVIVKAFMSSIYSGSSGGYTYWDFIDFSTVWEDIVDKYEHIPAGKYKLFVYMDNALLTTRTFTFK